MGRLVLLGFIFLIISNQSFADDDHNDAYRLLRSGDILPLEKILEISRKQITGRILEVELEHEDNQFIYEIEVLDKKGIVWEIKINAATGTILDVEQD